MPSIPTENIVCTNKQLFVFVIACSIRQKVYLNILNLLFFMAGHLSHYDDMFESLSSPSVAIN